MPYDLLASLAMAAIVAVSLGYVLVKKRQGSLTMRRTAVAAMSAALLCAVIFAVGHTSWNREHQLGLALENLDSSQSLAAYSDQDAMREIASLPEPLDLQVLSEAKVPGLGADLFYDETVKINGETYQVRIACYMYPLSWTPFETWQVNAVSKAL